MWCFRHWNQAQRGMLLMTQKATTMAFLAVQNSSIGDLVTHSLTHSLTESLRTLLVDIQRATQEACDLWDTWSEWWENMTWPTFWQFLTNVALLTIFLTLFYNFQQFWHFLTIFDNFWQWCTVAIGTRDCWFNWSEWWRDYDPSSKNKMTKKKTRT